MPDVEIIKSPISVEQLKQIAAKRFGDMVKAVVDVEKRIMTVGAELHADEEAALLDAGSKQNDLWGINIYVEKPRESWVEFDSMVNLRPSQGNRTRGVDDEKIRAKIVEIVNALII